MGSSFSTLHHFYSGFRNRPLTAGLLESMDAPSSLVMFRYERKWGDGLRSDKRKGRRCRIVVVVT